MKSILFLGISCILTVAQAQVSRDPCLNYECNNGYCESPLDVPYCVCDPMYDGDRCDIFRNPCATTVCENGGYCDAPTDFPFCVCLPGYTGRSCEETLVDDIGALCDTVQCGTDTECRVVYQCTDCQPEARCVDVTQAQVSALDSQCSVYRYLQALLVATPLVGTSSNTVEMTGKTCSTGLFDQGSCPPMSACVDNGRGGGFCCTGKPTVKEGSCPAVDPNSFGICGGTFCSSDPDCPGDAKCCESNCGGKLCTAVDLGCGRCRDGELCLQRPASCPVGVDCDMTESLVATCVPESCKDCRPDQECREVPNLDKCLPGPNCPQHKYFCAMKGYYGCGPDLPCPQGEVCTNNILCQSAPMEPPVEARRRRQAVRPVLPTPQPTWAPIYDPYCARDTRCELDTRQTTRQPKEKYGSCPKIESGSVGVCGGTFCSEDSGCPGEEKCCASACGGQLCTRPVYLTTLPTTTVTPTPYYDDCKVLGWCPWGQECVDTGLRCRRREGQCPGQWECREIKTTLPPTTTVATPPPPCGGRCSRREVCQLTRGGAVEECVPSTSPVCLSGCGEGEECQWRTPTCTWFCFFLARGPEPTCVPTTSVPPGPTKPAPAGVCPKAPGNYNRFLCMFLRVFMSDGCQADGECGARGQKCCVWDCGQKLCKDQEPTTSK